MTCQWLAKLPAELLGRTKELAEAFSSEQLVSAKFDELGLAALQML